MPCWHKEALPQFPIKMIRLMGGWGPGVGGQGPRGVVMLVPG